MNIIEKRHKDNNKIMSNTDGINQEEGKSHYKISDGHRKNVYEWLSGFDFKYFITITFAFDINSKKRNNQVKEIINMLSNEYFNRNQRKKGFFLEGFCFVEKQGTRNEHYHILIQDNNVFNFKRNRNKDFRNVCFDKCSRIETFNKLSIDTNIVGSRSHGLDVQTTYSDRIVEYLTKTYEKTGNFDFIKPLDNYGFSSVY